ncbi:MAG: winged helix DNA-binding domain-containing protein [Thermoplasmata archaeon]|nr:winged helix DNA-binding domain-containing protein [Thermoplasmata archaeon]
MPADSLATARRFVLGRQGLWPGRRWRGQNGVVDAVRYVGSVQVDPLDVVGHNQDLALWARVVGYRVEHLQRALYEERSLFEYGGNLQIRPIEELPYLRIVMERKVAEDRWNRFARAKRTVVARVQREVESRGPLSSRDLGGDRGAPVASYRARTEAGLALYYLWLKGDLLVSSRRRGEKVFDLASRLLPRPDLGIPVEVAEEHLILGTLRDLGLATSSEWLAYAHGRIGRSTLRRGWAEQVERWQRDGKIQRIEVDGWAGGQWLVGDAMADVESLRGLEVPRSWRPHATTTDDEAVFLAPFEPVSARGRGRRLFDFDYVWEAYKPVSARRWGYYTLPILYRDELRGRIEFQFDRTSRCLRVAGCWLDDPADRRSKEFAVALGRGIARLVEFLDAERVDLAGLGSPSMEGRVRAGIRVGEGGPQSRNRVPEPRSPVRQRMPPGPLPSTRKRGVLARVGQRFK